MEDAASQQERWNSWKLFRREKYFWKPCSCCKETIVVYILRIDHRGIYCKNIYNYIIRIAYPEHLMA